jgi:hypothetical protein
MLLHLGTSIPDVRSRVTRDAASTPWGSARSYLHTSGVAGVGVNEARMVWISCWPRS